MRFTISYAIVCIIFIFVVAVSLESCTYKKENTRSIVQDNGVEMLRDENGDIMYAFYKASYSPTKLSPVWNSDKRAMPLIPQKTLRYSERMYKGVHNKWISLNLPQDKWNVIVGDYKHSNQRHFYKVAWNSKDTLVWRIPNVPAMNVDYQAKTNLFALDKSIGDYSVLALMRKHAHD